MAVFCPPARRGLRVFGGAFGAGSQESARNARGVLNTSSKTACSSRVGVVSGVLAVGIAGASARKGQWLASPTQPRGSAVRASKLLDLRRDPLCGPT